MMNVSFKKLILALFLAPISLNVFAVDCNGKSSSLINNSEKYYTIVKSVPLTRDESNKISKILKPFVKRVAGKKTLSDCSFENNTSTIQIKKYKLKGKLVDKSDGSYDLFFTEELLPNRFYYEMLVGILHLNTNFVVSNITKNGFEVVEKYRQSNSGNGTNFIENTSVFVVNRKTLNISTTSYLNGYFSYVSEMELK